MHGNMLRWKNMVILDANMILRYLLNDNKEMAERADEYIQGGEATATIEVIAEVVYVLKGVYQLQRRQIADTLNDFLDLVQSRDIDVLKKAVKTYGTENLDFVDCVLSAYHSVNDAEIATFDGKLLKLLQNSSK